MAGIQTNCHRTPQFKKTRFSILAILFLIHTATVMQSAGITDFIVLNSGDTLHGTVQHIDDRGVSPKFHKKIRLVDANGKKQKFHRKDVMSFSAARQVYESFWLKQSSDRISFDNPRYDISPRVGEQYFLKRISQGSLSHYQLEWWEQSESTLMSMDLLKKENDRFLIRATQGVFGLKKKVLANYFDDCPQVKTQIEQGKVKQVWEAVDLYNVQCAD